jgi:uncharacterized protein (TIGR00369 family)
MTELLESLPRIVPFWHAMGIQLLEVAQGRAVLTIRFREEFLQNGVLHGGVLASLLDSACACAALSLTWPDTYAATVGLQVYYLKPVTAGLITARAECLRAGRSILFCEAHARDEGDALVAHGTSQLTRIPPR